MLELLSDYTVQNVALGAALTGTISGVLGCFAVLRRQSLLGDALSHAALPGVCLGFIVAGGRNFGAVLIGALLSGALAALCVMALTRGSRLKTDAALGIVLSVFFAGGIVLLTHIQGGGNASQGGLESFLFGQAAAIPRSDLWTMGAVTLAALTVVAALWKELKLVTFDPVFAATLGLPVAGLEALLTVMIALAVVVGLQMVGVILMAAMVIAPAVAARQWSGSLGAMVAGAAGVGTVAGVGGALVSATGRGLSTGPLIVLAASAIAFAAILLAPGRGVAWSALRQARERRALKGRQVLATLHRLAQSHRDPAYPAEQGTVDSYHGIATRRVLARLERRGLVRAVAHAPERTKHWELTERGIAEAQALAETGRMR